MNVALFLNARDHRVFIIGGCFLVVLFVVVFLFAIDSLPMEQTEVWMNVPWIKSLISSLMGSEMTGHLRPAGWPRLCSRIRWCWPS
ncbi:MAG: hypothetical protein R3E58_08065 [Phycisphaerae bacterium]